MWSVFCSLCNLLYNRYVCQFCDINKYSFGHSVRPSFGFALSMNAPPNDELRVVGLW